MPGSRRVTVATRSAVTDNRQWASPAAPRRPGAAQAPVLAPPPSPRSSGWTPPPARGLVPLRPMTLGTLLGAAFGVLRGTALATFGPALVVCLVLAVVKALGAISLLSSAFASGSGDTAAVGSVFSGISGGVLSWLGGALLDLAGTQIVLAIVSIATAGSVVGEARPLGAVWRRTARRRGAVVAWAAFVALGGILGIGIAVGLVVLLAALGSVGTVLAVIVGVLAVPGGVVLWSWLTTRLAFVPPALVVERLRMGAAIRRSWRLTRRSFWRVFGTRLLVAAMVGVGQGILFIPIQVVAGWVVTLALPNGATADAGQGLVIAVTLVTQVVGSFVTAIALVVTTAATALLYLDARMRKEGLDLELARYVEHDPAVRRTLPDPFRHPGAAT